MANTEKRSPARHARVLSVKDPQSVRASPEMGDDAAFEQLFRGAPMTMWVYDLDTLEFLRVNRAATEKYGYPEDMFLGMRITDIHPQDEIHRLRNHVQELRQNLPSSRLISRYWRHILKDGQTIWVDTYSQPFDYHGRHCAIVSATEVTVRKQAEDRLKVQNAFFRQLFDASPEAVVLLDPEDRVVDINRTFRQMFGYGLDEIRSQRLESFLVPEFLKREIRDSYARMSRPGLVHAHTQRTRKDGTLVDVALSAFPIEVDGARIGTYLMYADRTERRAAAANRDARPPPPDAARGMLERESLLLELGRRGRDGGQPQALLQVDLDQFAHINQACGHDAGEQLLLRISEVIRACTGAGMAAYLGGDEYVLLLDDTNEESLLALAGRIQAGVEAIRFRWDGRLHPVSAGIGIVIIRDARMAPAAQLAMAETACRVAKAKGRGKLHLADAAAPDVLQWEDETLWSSKIRGALQQNRFVMYAQRVTPLSRREDQPRHEILLRMLTEEGMVASPARFLAHAARIGAVRDIDDWVLDTVLRELAPGGVHAAWPGVLHLNVAEESLRDADLGARVARKLAARGVAGARLCFELSEPVTARNPERARRFAEAVREAGCEVALDDFGAGLTSLQSLQDLPLDYLKIDGAFVERLSEDPADQAVIEGLSLMARRLGIKTVAEAVDNSATLECVHALGVDYAQGYGIHRPEPFYPTRPL